MFLFPRGDKGSRKRANEDGDGDVSIVVHRQQHDEVRDCKLKHVDQGTNTPLSKGEYYLLPLGRNLNTWRVRCRRDHQTVAIVLFAVVCFDIGTKWRMGGRLMDWRFELMTKIRGFRSTKYIQLRKKTDMTSPRLVLLDQISIVLSLQPPKNLQHNDEEENADAGAREVALRGDMPEG